MTGTMWRWGMKETEGKKKFDKKLLLLPLLSLLLIPLLAARRALGLE